MGRWTERARRVTIAQPITTPNDRNDITTELSVPPTLGAWGAANPGAESAVSGLTTPERNDITTEAPQPSEGALGTSVVTPTTEVLAEAEPNGWRWDAQASGWVETAERVASCVHGDGPLDAGNLLYCAGHRARMTDRFGYGVGDGGVPAQPTQEA